MPFFSFHTLRNPCTCLHIHIHTYIHTSMYIAYIHTYTHTQVYAHTYVYACVHGIKYLNAVSMVAVRRAQIRTLFHVYLFLLCVCSCHFASVMCAVCMYVYMYVCLHHALMSCSQHTHADKYIHAYTLHESHTRYMNRIHATWIAYTLHESEQNSRYINA